MWLATWPDVVNNSSKYVQFAASSSLKGKSDYIKYETARKLKGKIDEIRNDYTEGFKSKDEKVRQISTAVYFIDKLALRVGNEKGEEEADTVGCCSLRLEHITLLEDNQVKFDFLGKDSIRYENTVTVDPKVHKNLKIFMKNKKPEDDLFDLITVFLKSKNRPLS
jgi:DNA topoisomerase I